MSDDQNESAPSEQQEDPKGLRKLFEAEKARNAALEAKIAESEREAVFAKAGVPDNPLGAMLRKSYDGDMNPDAVRSFMVEAGVIQEERTTPPDEREALLRAQGEQEPNSRPSGNEAITAVQQAISSPDMRLNSDAIEETLRKSGLYPR